MRLFVRIAVFGLVLALAQAVQAQLTPLKGVPPSQAERYVRSIPLRVFMEYVSTHGVPVERSNGSMEEPGLRGVVNWTSYAWLFRGVDVFYSKVAGIRTDATPPPLCGPDVPLRDSLEPSCYTAVSNYSQCHLFIFGVDRNLLGVLPLRIPQADFIPGKTSCFDAPALAPAKVVKDGMLIVLGYYDSRWLCQSGQLCASDSPAAYPDPYYKTTVLVRFDKDSDGKLTMRQDDDCLAPLNKFSTIAEARRALVKAGCN